MVQPAGLPSLLAVVADGIGGHRAGEVAAELAVELISRSVAESDGQQPLYILQEALIRASQAIHKSAQENPEQRGMGSTCVCAWIIGDNLYTATVGDSRIYLLRAGGIYQLTPRLLLRHAYSLANQYTVHISLICACYPFNAPQQIAHHSQKPGKPGGHPG